MSWQWCWWDLRSPGRGSCNPLDGVTWVAIKWYFGGVKTSLTDIFFSIFTQFGVMLSHEYLVYLLGNSSESPPSSQKRGDLESCCACSCPILRLLLGKVYFGFSQWVNFFLLETDSDWFDSFWADIKFFLRHGSWRRILANLNFTELLKRDILLQFSFQCVLIIFLLHRNCKIFVMLMFTIIF